MENLIDVMIGAKVTLLRLERGLDVAALATVIGCPSEHLAQFERGAHIPVTTLMALCSALQTTFKDLMADVPNNALGRLISPESIAAVDGLRLHTAFLRIADPDCRKFLIDLAERLADCCPERRDAGSDSHR